MSHVAPEPPSRRRVDRIVGVVLALVGIGVAAVAVIALQSPKRHVAADVAQTTTVTVTATPPPTPARSSTSAAPRTTASRPPSSSPPAASVSPVSAAHPIPLIVLNNTDEADLAATARARFEQGGWTVTSIGPLHNDILSTCAYYDPADPAAEQAAAQLQQQFPAIKRIKAKFDGLPPGPVVVVLTTDYS